MYEKNKLLFFSIFYNFYSPYGMDVFCIKNGDFMNHKSDIYEDEIDLRELLRTILKYKMFIFIFALLTTIGAITYAYSKTPIYEVKANIQLGHIGEQPLANIESIVKTLSVVFYVDEITLKEGEEYISEVASISVNKKVGDFIEVVTLGISNDKAKQKAQEVLVYLKKMHEGRLEEFIYDNELKISNAQREIEKIQKLEIPNTLHQIDVYKNQEIKKIDEKIERLQTQDIKKIEQKIELLQEQDIVKIDEKIDRLKTQNITKLERKISLLTQQELVKLDEKIAFLTTVEIPSIKTKILHHQRKIQEYNESINALQKSTTEANDATTMIASIQMVNYQNLILNSQNKLEELKVSLEKLEQENILALQRQKANIKNVEIKDLELEIKNINDVDISNLLRQKQNIQDVQIKDLKLQIQNIKDVEIVNLIRQKENIQNETLRNLQYKAEVLLPLQVQKLQEKIAALKYEISPLNLSNHTLVGDFVQKDTPAKPKKKLIVVVAFVTSLILAVFMVFFIEFFRKEKLLGESGK